MAEVSEKELVLTEEVQKLLPIDFEQGMYSCLTKRAYLIGVKARAVRSRSCALSALAMGLYIGYVSLDDIF